MLQRDRWRALLTSTGLLLLGILLGTSLCGSRPVCEWSVVVRPTDHSCGDATPRLVTTRLPQQPPSEPTALAAALFNYIEQPQLWCQRLAMLGGSARRGQHREVVDGHKFVCLDTDVAPRRPCLVYSLGGNDEWSFEMDVIQTFGCEMHTFDPSMPERSGRETHGAHLHALALAGADGVSWRGWRLRTLTSLRRQLGHERRQIDYLKVDVEGSEWAWLESDIESLRNVSQIGMEIHIGSKNVGHLRRIYAALYSIQEAGFRTVFSEPNRVWRRTQHVEGVREPVGLLYEMLWVRPCAVKSENIGEAN